jgi:hypothetical protein
MKYFPTPKKAFLRKNGLARAVSQKITKLFDGIFSSSRRLKKIEKSLSDVRDLLLDY